VIQPNITHLPCDLNQQRKRADARKDSLARAVAARSGRRSLLSRILRRRHGPDELDAGAFSPPPAEDVFHAFRL
jgi:hypothetical protein